MYDKFNLIVVNPFNDYQRGSYITDSEIIKSILDPSSESHHFAQYVRRVDAPFKNIDYVTTTSSEITEEATTVSISTVSAVDDSQEPHTENLGDEE